MRAVFWTLLLHQGLSATLSDAYYLVPYHNGSGPMAGSASLKNQQRIIANQKAILRNQSSILRDLQATLRNQKRILANQSRILAK